MSQTQASDQWSFYQAKSVKGNIYEIEKEKLELELRAMDSKATQGVREEYRKKIDEYGKKIARYDGEKSVIQNEAKHYEQIRDDAQKHSQTFGIAVIFLQIAILLSSIAALIKKKLVWVLGMALGVVGIVYFVNGFLLFF
jgi:hypothetical protein